MGPDARVKYFQSTDNKLSDIEGKMLSNSKQEALEKAFINNARSLKKKYIAYDVFGNGVTSGDSEEDAIRTLQQKILTESKFVSIQEYQQWNLNYKIDFASVISDGRYVVYRIKDPNNLGKFIYYASLEKALASVKSSLRVSDKVVEKYTSCFLYNYKSQDGEIIPIIYFNYDVDYVANLISTNYLKH
ncbi:hypothetical protein SCLARK_00667 [Spiroplasma clarkii]|nr:hypothetical protein [Spiroplasma clarkii]ARU91330.1 hypothetical protein SCLARK_00667 [Spiroplasma clarkii]